MDKQKVLEFLIENPDFLLEHASELGLNLRDHKIRSFAQAKWQASQMKIQKMAEQLQEICNDSEANNLTTQRILALDLALLTANTIDQLVDAVYYSLSHDFGLKQFVFALITPPKNNTYVSDGLMVMDAKIRLIIEQLEKPILGSKISPEIRALLPKKDILPESFLQLPIKINGQTGAIIIAADECANRFTADLQTSSIERMADAIGVTLSRIMGY